MRRINHRKREILEAWRGRAVEGLFTVAGLVVVFLVFSDFVNEIEHRDGVVLYDPVLDLLPSVDLTWPIFILLYSALFAAIGGTIRRPGRMIAAMRAYAFMVLVRLLTLWVTPLDPPEGLILLRDPITDFGFGANLTKDLFFSGHTATLLILTLAVERNLKPIFLVATIALGTMLLFHHIHYTVDVLAAPFFAYGAWKISAWIGDLIKR